MSADMQSWKILKNLKENNLVSQLLKAKPSILWHSWSGPPNPKLRVLIRTILLLILTFFTSYSTILMHIRISFSHYFATKPLVQIRISLSHYFATKSLLLIRIILAQICCFLFASFFMKKCE